MILRALILAGAMASAGVAGADTRLTDPSRAALGAALRDVLRANPDLLRRAQQPEHWRSAVETDRAMIAAAADALFADPALERLGRRDGPAEMAVFYDPDAATWPELRAALRDLARGRPGLGIALHPQSGEIGPLGSGLGLDLLPSYVLPGLILRGDVPVAIIPRYLPTP